MRAYTVASLAAEWDCSEGVIRKAKSTGALITAVVLWVFMLGGMKRELVPGRWQMMVTPSSVQETYDSDSSGGGAGAEA